MTRRLIAFLIVLSPLLGSGCSSGTPGGGSDSAPQGVLLHEVAEMLRANTQPNGRGPSKLADLNGSQMPFPQGYQAVKSGEVVVVWGAKMPGEAEAGSAPANVIAYEKKAETDGGWVLLQNGAIKQMTADEFKSAPKAK